MPNPERPHDPEHNHAHSQLSQMELRVRALESVLTQKGYIDPAALDLLIETYEKKSALTMGPELSPRRGSMRNLSREWRRGRRSSTHRQCRHGESRCRPRQYRECRSPSAALPKGGPGIAGPAASGD